MESIQPVWEKALVQPSTKVTAIASSLIPINRFNLLSTNLQEIIKRTKQEDSFISRDFAGNQVSRFGILPAFPPDFRSWPFIIILR
jgi:hypothetical protein